MSNIKKIQSMLSGEYKKIQVGAEPKTIAQRKEGEVWVEASRANPHGATWTKENGKRVQITKNPGRGFRNCKDCDKLILKTLDEDTYNRMQRCYYCQLNFEEDLKMRGKWKEWVEDLEKQRWESMEKEFKEILFNSKDSTDMAFDKSVAYAVGNSEQVQNREKIKKGVN